MFLGRVSFLEDERNAPLLNMNLEDFLKREVQPNSQKYGEKFKSLVLQTNEITKKREELPLLETPRILFLDAERTFLKENHRKELVSFLTRVITNLRGDYSQALSYISGFLLLVLDEATTMDIIVKLNGDPKYVPGYWKEEPVAAATDAYVFNHLVEKFFPKIAAQLVRHHVFPENYCQKWFGGLCIQILPFETLYPFFELFLEHGFKFLFQFGLSLVDLLQEHLLAADNAGAVFELLRLEPKVVAVTNKAAPNGKIKLDATKLLKHALDFDINDTDFATLRKTLFEKHLKERLAQAKAFAQKKKEEDNDSAEDSDEDGEDCDICHEMFPEYNCKECSLKICEQCHEDSKGTHKASHKVIPYEPEDNEKSDEEVDKLAANIKNKVKIENDETY